MSNNNQDSSTYILHFIRQTGGNQPTTIDNKAIDKFFIGNYAKILIMKDGWYPQFRGYQKNEIEFDLITDIRFKGNGLLLSRWIAEQYRLKVNVLSEATHFKCNHFITQGIVGYLINAGTDPDVENMLMKKVIDTMATLPAEPKFYHYGRITLKDNK